MNQLNVIITGANSGIGLATANKYLGLGHHVFTISRRTDTLDKLSKEYSDSLHVFKGDVSNIACLEDFYHSVSTYCEQIDVVIANAGIAVAEPLNEVTEKSFDTTFDINVKGVFFTVQKSISLLSKTAAIVLIGSIQAGKGAGIWASYGAAKAAVRSLARSFAAELAPRGIRVNCLSPGVTNTPILGKFGFHQDELNKIIEHVESTTPLGRLGTPDEIANAIFFLCSSEAGFITGAELQVDGGLAQL